MNITQTDFLFGFLKVVIASVLFFADLSLVVSLFILNFRLFSILEFTVSSSFFVTDLFYSDRAWIVSITFYSID